LCIDLESIAGPPQPPEGYDWVLVSELSDEFNGDSLNKSKWLDYCTYWDGRPPSRFNPANVELRNGKLVIHASAVEGDTQHLMDTGIIMSKAVLSNTGRYFEARIKPAETLLSSAFWLQGKFSEIDVAEQIGAAHEGGDLTTKLRANSHYFPEGWATAQKTPLLHELGYPSASRFQTIGGEWHSPQAVSIYHDDKKVGRMEFRGEFTEPMHLFLSLEAVPWFGVPSQEELDDPNVSFLIDWIRVWRLEMK